MKIRAISIIILILCYPIYLTAHHQLTDTTTNRVNTRFTANILNEAPVKLIPFPKKVKWKHQVVLMDNIQIGKGIPLSLQDELSAICKAHTIRITTHSSYTVVLSIRKSLPKEGYRLEITTEGIDITASDNAGAYYALQTLRQLIEMKDNQPYIHLCNIEDAPQHHVRGFMIDVGRNFQSIEMLKKQLDIMAKYKLNTFHWHLTDRPAWRIESKKYPELTAAKHHRPSRNPGKYYTYDEIRDFITYAQEHYIQVIPEIDMPGHSNSFRNAMKCNMESPKGMEILTDVLNEFCQEIPKELAPIIHIGSDEVHIPNAKAFIRKMVKVVEDNGRRAMVWAPGLEADKNVIRQTWGRGLKDTSGLDEVDSQFNYINNGEPMSFIHQLFFKPVGFGSSNHILGGIMCLWPDVNVWHETDIYRQHPVYSALLTYAWTTWTADIISAPESYQINLPANDTEALQYFAAFEKYILQHKKRYFNALPFPYFYQSNKHWQVIGPFDHNEGDSLVQDDTDSVYYKGKSLIWKAAVGNSLTIRPRNGKKGLFPKAKTGQTVYARTFIYSQCDTVIQAWINFESPLRANRTYTGIADNGSWDINGGEIWVNNKPLKGPGWNNPLWHPFKQKGWALGIDSEIPWTDEELYWLRKPSHIVLKKGWNKIWVKIPCTSDYQNWMFTFVLLDEYNP